MKSLIGWANSALEAFILGRFLMNIITNALVPAAFGMLLVAGFPLSVQAADPLCQRLKTQADKDRCACNSDLGGTVRQDPKSNLIIWTTSNRKQPQVFECMRQRGHRAG